MVAAKIIDLWPWASRRPSADGAGLKAGDFNSPDFFFGREHGVSLSYGSSSPVFGVGHLRSDPLPRWVLVLWENL